MSKIWQLNVWSFADPNIMKRFQVDRGAIKFVLSGANIMCPGLTSPGGVLDQEVEAERPVVWIKTVFPWVAFLFVYADLKPWICICLGHICRRKATCLSNRLHQNVSKGHVSQFFAGIYLKIQTCALIYFRILAKIQSLGSRPLQVTLSLSLYWYSFVP